MEGHNFNIGGNSAFHNFHRDYSHIQDASLRRRLILSEIDKVPFGWFHVRAVCVAGIGFFLDSYDIFVINLITQMLGQAFWNKDPRDTGESYGRVANGGTMPLSVQTAVKAATSGGAVLGQLGFGYLADKLGRRRMYGIELAIIVFATFAQALTSPSPALSMAGLLIFWRVIMGIGIGGDYPMSSVITSEYVKVSCSILHLTQCQYSTEFKFFLCCQSSKQLLIFGNGISAIDASQPFRLTYLLTQKYLTSIT